MFDWFWEFLYGIMKAIFFCIDFMIDIAGMLCGIEPVLVEGEKQDLVYYFITSDAIIGAFEAILVIGFILLFVFTAYSVFRSMGRLGEGKSAIQICLDSAKTLLYFFLVPIIMVVGIVVVSTVMTSIYDATSMGNSSLGGMLFSAAADGAYDGSETKQTVLQNFISGESGYNYNNTGHVDKYFDLEEMDYFIGYISGIAVLILIALSLFSFVERVIGIVLLFLVSPLSMSTTPLDDGARFKLWRDQVINKYLIAYGALLSINIFMLLVNTIQDIEFFDNQYLNQLAKISFIIGGAFACRKGTVVVGNLINSGAGTQDRMENASANSGLRQLAGMAFGATIGKAASFLGSVAGKPVNMLGSHIKKDISSAVHRSSNAKRTAKDKMQVSKYTEKLKAAALKDKSKSNASKGNGQTADPKASNNDNTNNTNNKHSTNTADTSPNLSAKNKEQSNLNTASPSQKNLSSQSKQHEPADDKSDSPKGQRTLKDVLAGSKSASRGYSGSDSNLNNNKLNDRSADTLKDAFKTASKKEGADGK